MTAPVGAVGASSAPAAEPAAEPTHGCVRCGRRVPIAVALCEDCNPLGLKQPAPTQVHAIAAGGIVAFVVFLAVIGRIALGGVGPFSGSIGGVSAIAGGMEVTISVTNSGTRNGATTCRVVAVDREVGGPSQIVQTPNVPAGTTIEFSSQVTVFGPQLQNLSVDCQSP